MLQVEALERRGRFGGVTFALAAGEIVALLGPPRSGKTALLRALAGLDAPGGGTISLDGVNLFGPGIDVAVEARDLAMLADPPALWPHRDALANVAFPLEVKGLPLNTARRRAERALEMVGAGGLGVRAVATLDDDQRQRVALARALVKEAKLVLLDDPLSRRDRAQRLEGREALRALLKRLGSSALIASDDGEEASALADRLIVMREGRMVETGSPEALYLQPRAAFTARLLGPVNLVDAEIIERRGAFLELRTRLGAVLAGAPQEAIESGQLLIRPEHLEFLEESAAPGLNILPGRVIEQRFDGRALMVALEISHGTLTAARPAGENHPPGTRLAVRLPRERCVLLGA